MSRGSATGSLNCASAGRAEPCLAPAFVCLTVASAGSVGDPSLSRRSSPGPVVSVSARSHVEHLSVVFDVDDSYLVDPASSHMLVSKIKPCMSKFTSLYGETANGSLNQSRFLR